MSTSYLNRKTPGVYVTEVAAFSTSIVGVDTAVPIFIGYTETAKDASGKQVYNKAIEINSLADYQSYFGTGFSTTFNVSQVPTVDGDGKPVANPVYDFQAKTSDGSTGLFLISADTLSSGTVPQFNLYMAIQLFYANGGSSAYVVSVANYWGTQDVVPPANGTPTAIDPDLLVGGLNVASNVIGPTMVVVPDACLLYTPASGETAASDTGYDDVVMAMFTQSAGNQDRVAILDLPGAVDPSTWTVTGLQASQEMLTTALNKVDSALGTAGLSYGAAYAPALEVTVLSREDVDFRNLYGDSTDGTTYPSIVTMNGLLTQQANGIYSGDKLTAVTAQIEAAYPAAGTKPTSYVTKADGDTSTPTDAEEDAAILSLNNYLINALALMGQTLDMLVGKLNVAPASGIMAGIWTRNDDLRGVWNAPANYVPADVVAPVVLLTNTDQEDYNVPLNGQSICILRKFQGRGTVVWGARTLDGNSQDWRYIQIRRTLNYIEQSIKTAIEPYVFAPNTAQTWTTVTSMISNFLTGLWSQGGLVGDKASDAFSVQCGLGSTMTSQDVLNGYMIVAVNLQMVHPAEYIELTFKQMMQGS